MSSCAIQTVAAAIIFDGTKVLIARRGPDEKMAGYWEFPGGKVEDGETLHECLIRELYEEFGFRAQAFETIAESEYYYEQGAIKLIAIRAEIIEGEIHVTVHDAVTWAEIACLNDYIFAPADIPIALKLQQMYVNFSGGTDELLVGKS